MEPIQQQQGDVAVTAEVAVEPHGDERIHNELVLQAIDALDGPDVEVRPGPMSAIVSGDLDAVLHAVHRAHSTAYGPVPRVITTVRLESSDGGVDLDARSRQVGAKGADPVEGPAGP